MKPGTVAESGRCIEFGQVWGNLKIFPSGALRNVCFSFEMLDFPSSLEQSECNSSKRNIKGLLLCFSTMRGLSSKTHDDLSENHFSNLLMTYR